MTQLDKLAMWTMHRLHHDDDAMHKPSGSAAESGIAIGGFQAVVSAASDT